MSSSQSFSVSRRRLIGLCIGATVTIRPTRMIAEKSNAYTFAVLGLDTRSNDANQRTDSIMVSRVDLDAMTVRTLSIPRDLYVEIPGFGDSKINDAYQLGLASDPALNWQSGAKVTVDTIVHNFGVGCDGVAVLQLQLLPAVIDAVGGIEVDNPYAVYVPDFPNFSGGGTRTLDFPEGLLTLDGESTVDFVRTRQQDSDGGRVMRQHLVLIALLEELQQPAMIPKIPELVAALSDVVRTDIPSDVQMSLIAALPEIRDESLAFTNIENQLWSDYTAEGAWIYRGDWSILPGNVQSWLSGEID